MRHHMEVPGPLIAGSTQSFSAPVTAYSGMAQRKRIGPITQGSVDRNYLPLNTSFFAEANCAKFGRRRGTELTKLF
jgi:hypothetical protein